MGSAGGEGEHCYGSALSPTVYVQFILTTQLLLRITPPPSLLTILK